ncbi:linear amide C-N hydrolase [Echinicola salinicaeni]|uniref:linear amide C-N hydrolase n=1 Tax=Echinicola salinicaeni TaxID=2762757 RepID=UPI001C943451|nr:linear amide C-N hydrolase [Echinicola salinicaeni]
MTNVTNATFNHQIRKVKMMKYLLTICFSTILLFPKTGTACSMYKLTQNGRTIVGNNEDWTSPNGQFWFEVGKGKSYGIMYMGFLDNFAQGAINEAGLMFDGFYEPYLEVKNVEGKLEIPIGDAIKKVMQTMSTVEEVQSYLNTINLTILENGQLVFVDKSGTYLIIEGDKMFLGDEDEKTFSNFYYSQINSLEDVMLPYFQKGRNFIETTEKAGSLDYCGKAMENFAQNGRIAPTQYTTIYDLNTLKIRVHLFHDYSDYIELDLISELQKGNHRKMIAELFPENSKGYIHYKKYNNPEHPTLLLEELIGNNEITEQEFLNQGFNNIINDLGYEWLNQIKNPEGAIKVFKYGLTLMPNNANLYDSLGEAYFVSKEWDDAIVSYAKSLVLDPQNKNAIKMIAKVNKQREMVTK